MNASKHGTKELPGWKELANLCSKCVHRTQTELHTFVLLLYTSAMAAIVNLQNINGNAAGRLFEWWTSPSMVPKHFLGGEELQKICSESVRCTQIEQHTFLLLQYTSAMAAIGNLLNINGDAAGRLLKRRRPWRMVPINFLGGKELLKICSKCVRRVQPEQHTYLLLKYTSATPAIVNPLIINGDAAGQLFEQWTPPSLVSMHFQGGE